MKRSKIITSVIIIFFLVVALIIIGRYAVGLHFKKKFSKRPPPGVIVEIVTNKETSEKKIDRTNKLSDDPRCLLKTKKNEKFSRNERCPVTGKKYKNCCGAL